VKVHLLERRQLLEQPLEDVFDFFAEARNLERITPPWLSFEVVAPEPVQMATGTLIGYRLRLHGLPLRWTSRIEAWKPGSGFIDRQVLGPYGLWHHQHSFERTGRGTLIGDRVHYGMPLGPLGEIAHPLFVRGDLERIFDFRQAAVEEALT
jgi:hypothetical protein